MINMVSADGYDRDQRMIPILPFSGFVLKISLVSGRKIT